MGTAKQRLLSGPFAKYPGYTGDMVVGGQVT